MLRLDVLLLHLSLCEGRSGKCPGDRRLHWRINNRRRFWSARVWHAEKIISVEVGGRLKHRRIPSRNIFTDLKKNLARFGVLEDVTLINGRSFEETPIRDQVDELVSAGRLVPLGYYGWGTWVGQWQRK